MIGTIAIDTGDGVLPAVHTTPEAYEIQKYLAQMVDNGCDTCVMEVSSQGLKMQRVEGIFFDIGMFLNIEPDHIGEGEHASFAEYLFCKSRLMRQCRIGIVNRDDPHTERILQGHTCSVETFSLRHPADVTAENIRFFMQSGELWGSFLVRGKTAVYPVRMLQCTGGHKGGRTPGSRGERYLPCTPQRKSPRKMRECEAVRRLCHSD